MGFSALEIAGLALIGIDTVMQISAVGTLKWRTIEKTELGIKVIANYGLFSACIKGDREICVPTGNDNEDKDAYNGIKATAILTILALFALLGIIPTAKLYLKRSPILPTIIIGSLAVIFGITTVTLYVELLKFPKEIKLGASFYVACVASGLALLGVVISSIGTMCNIH